MPVSSRHSLLAFGAVLVLASSTGAKALDLGVNLGGLDVGVSVGGGGGGLGVDVGVGNTDLNVGVGGDSGGIGLGVDLDGDGIPETGTEGLTDGLSLKPLGQEGALKAVQSHRALPLEDILVRARLVADGEIIDAQLIQVRRILVYEIKVLGKSGDVSKLYFYARSGALVAPK
jgi:hypothetical protein